MPLAAACRRLVPMVAILAMASGCEGASRPALNLNDGRQHFTQDRVSASVTCDGRPFEVDANRVSLTITGPCSHVVVAGNHNDIETDVLANGTVEITGAHNDVTWRKVGSGSRPILVDRGVSNTFHRGIRDSDDLS